MAQPTNVSSYKGLPAGTPPPGTVPNFHRAKSLAPVVYTAQGLCIGITSIFVLLRFYAKIFVQHTWSWDDLTLLLGFGFLLAQDAVVFSIVGQGIGRGLGVHIWDIQVDDLNKDFIQRDQIVIDLFAFATVFVKLSLFILYLRLFRPNALTRYLVIFGMVICSLFYAISIIIDFVLWIPSPSHLNDDDAAWRSRAHSSGPTETSLSLAQGIFGMISDIYLLVIPIQMVSRLHLPTRRKVGICAVFATGIIAIACSAVGTAYRAILVQSNDSTWSGAIPDIFGSVEISAGIVCACMPLLPSLVTSASSTFSKQKVFHLPSRIRFYFSRFSLHKWSSSARRALPLDAQTSHTRHAQNDRYIKTPSEQELSLEFEQRNVPMERTGRLFYEHYDRASNDGGV